MWKMVRCQQCSLECPLLGTCMPHSSLSPSLPGVQPMHPSGNPQLPSPPASGMPHMTTLRADCFMLEGMRPCCQSSIMQPPGHPLLHSRYLQSLQDP